VVGDILNGAFELYQKHWKHLIGIAFAFYLVAATITLLLTVALGRWGAFAASLILLVGIMWLTGALVGAVADIRDGRADLTIGETFAKFWPRVWPLTGASILAGFGIFIGFLLLIVPGFILLTWWAFIAPAIVLEHKGVFESFGRSRQLVQGNGWSVFGVLIITWLLTGVVSGVISAIFTPLPNYLSQYFGNLIGGAIAAPFSALAVTLMYFRLSGAEAPVPPGEPPEPALPS
jgi:hypothetical protein